MRKHTCQFFIVLMASMWVLAACASPPAATPLPAAASQSAGISNPASDNCVKQGGEVVIMKSPAGEYGVCDFGDGMRCEEWAMMRGDCPVGGIKTTGYVTDAAAYCALTGGDYNITGESNTENEQGTCTFKNGKSCDVWQFYKGECTP